jgi:hypothetical protein
MDAAGRSRRLTLIFFILLCPPYLAAQDISQSQLNQRAQRLVAEHRWQDAVAILGSVNLAPPI